MSAPTVVKLNLQTTPDQEWYLVVDPTGQRGTLVRIATSTTTGNISVMDVQDLTKRGT